MEEPFLPAVIADEPEPAIPNEPFDGATWHSATPCDSRSCSTIAANFAIFRHVASLLARALAVYNRPLFRQGLFGSARRSMARAGLIAVGCRGGVRARDRNHRGAGAAGPGRTGAGRRSTGRRRRNRTRRRRQSTRALRRDGRGGAPIQMARAAIKGASGINGTATLYEIANGGNGHMVQIILTCRARLPGMHGVHIHADGTMRRPDFKSAGGHFDPGSGGESRPRREPSVSHGRSCRISRSTRRARGSTTSTARA